MARRWVTFSRAPWSGSRRSVTPTSKPDEHGWHFDTPDEHDTPAEVEATVRTLRRVSIWHFALFLGTVLLVPLLTVALDWWSEGRLVGGMSPNFAMAAAGLYAFFFIISVAAARLSNAVESRMLGHTDEHLPDTMDPDARNGDTS
ncbi:MAG TPA: hypothetical protein VK053_06545 [Jiangellaceae bacterium]|nr:hypothetical protein [Jiangellaceae bacterium]